PGHLLGLLARDDELGLELLPLADVLAGGVDVGDAAGLVADGPAAVADPPLGAGLRPDPHLEVDGVAVEEPAQLGLHEGAVVLVDDLEEAVEVFDLLRRVAADALERLRGPLELGAALAADAERVGVVRGELRDGPVAELAAAEGAL